MHIFFKTSHLKQKCQSFCFWQYGVFWQMCHKIIMVPGKDTIKSGSVFWQRPNNNSAL
jgi:hypothetical protein